MSEAFDPYYEWLSIPPEEQPANFYRLLGVKGMEANLNVIGSAADRQMSHVRHSPAGRGPAFRNACLTSFRRPARCCSILHARRPTTRCSARPRARRPNRRRLSPSPRTITKKTSRSRKGIRSAIIKCCKGSRAMRQERYTRRSARAIRRCSRLKSCRPNWGRTLSTSNG